jgi:aminoglycoside 3-N-acetyltransferase
VGSLTSDLRALGVQPGMTVLVHSSLSSLGWVVGGAHAVVLALEGALTDTGTLVMPTHSSELSEPARWHNPPVPATWWPVIRDQMPTFDPDLTATRGMGLIAETFRKQVGVLRSRHPQVSFAAWGRHREVVTQKHGLAMGQGETSPLARLYELDAAVLLLGVGHACDTSIHLAEYRSTWAGKTHFRNGMPVVEEGARVWKEFDDVVVDERDFDEVGTAFEATQTGGQVKLGRVGNANARLLNQRALVDFAVHWFEDHRG